MSELISLLANPPSCDNELCAEGNHKGCLIDAIEKVLLENECLHGPYCDQECSGAE